MSQDERHIRLFRNGRNQALRKRSGRRLADELDQLAQHCANLPVLEDNSIDDILGYDDNGLPN